VLAFGMLGLWLARTDAWRHRLLWYFLLAGFAALMCKPPVIGRYRLAPTAVLLIYGGAAGAWFTREIQGRRWRPIIGATVAVVLLGLLSASLLGSHERRMRHRGTEFLLAGEVYYHRHERERALEELRAGLRSAYRGPDQTALPRDFRAVALEFATVARELGRDADAVAELRRLAAELPRDATLTRLLVALDRPSASQP
jgi:hypothetical protein